jgi:hypothetical protein
MGFLFSTSSNVFAKDSTTPNMTPTLDSYSNAGVTIGNTNIVYPNSDYSIKKVDSSNDFTILDYTWDKSTNAFKLNYYELDLKQTEYGEINPANTFKTNKYEAHVTDTGTVDIQYQYNIPQSYINEQIRVTSQLDKLDKNFIGSNGNQVGGAIVNTSIIKQLTGNFIENYVNTTHTDSASGGAIYNYGSDKKISDISGHFIGNYVEGNAIIMGGAIYNYYSTIDSITGDFVENYTNATTDVDNEKVNGGGAIYNGSASKIGDISGDFIANHANSNNTSAIGGAVFNVGNIGKISGNFIENYSKSAGHIGYGGAIANQSGMIEGITGSFVGNYIEANNFAGGGAIYSGEETTNLSYKIGYIVGDFIENYATSNESLAFGGAICNGNTIGFITGDFIGNSTNNKGAEHTIGGAIYNYGEIGDITGHFFENSSSAESSIAQGGAIYNSGTLKDINGDFVSNFTVAPNAAEGGAIYNHIDSTINDIVSNFEGNYVQSTTDSADGGAIFNSGKIRNITGNFDKNSATAQKGAVGGAIYNIGEINSIKGDFRENTTSSNSDGVGCGTAIYNAGEIKSIEGDFLNNTGKSNNTASSIAGTLSNDGTITNIKSDFTGNKVISEGKAYGGAIYNTGSISSIEGTSSQNSTSGANTSYGGAIYNYNGTIKKLSVDFNDNYSLATATKGTAIGGAIFNNGIINNITGDFSGNYTYSKYNVSGGALYNSGILGTVDDNGNVTASNLNSNFKNNYALGAISYGGAIYNIGNIGDITGAFDGNYGYSTSKTYGGTVFNNGSIGNISSKFTNSFGASTADVYGGAIYNYKEGVIKDITSEFVGNYSTGKRIYGGVLYNSGKVGNIKSTFSSTYSSGTTNTYGGVIYSTGTIGDIKSDFTGSYSVSDGQAYGGVIFNGGKVGDIDSDFSGGYANATGAVAGGIIYNTGTIGQQDESGNITGGIYNSFTKNHALSESGSAKGGAIFNSTNGKIGDIVGDFTSCSATTDSTKDSALGGAIYNAGKIGNLKGDYISNYVTSAEEASGAFLYNTFSKITVADGKTTSAIQTVNTSELDNSATYSYGQIGNITGYFQENLTISLTETNGGLITNGGVIGDINSTFKHNSVISGGSVYGGLIFNSGTIGNINSEFITNIVQADNIYGGVIYNSGTIKNISGDFTGFHSNSNKTAYGAVLYNSGVIGERGEDGVITGGFINSNFIGNYVIAQEAKGGAIYTVSDLNIIADNKEITISGNYTNSNGTIDDNAIYVGSTNATLNFKLQNGAKINMIDNIDGAYEGVPSVASDELEEGETATSKYNSYSVNIQGDSVTGTEFYMPNDMRMADLSVGKTTINTINNNVHVYQVNNFTVTSNTNFIADVDLKHQTMDRIESNSYGEHSGILSVTGMNLISDAPENIDKIEIYFAQKGLKDNVERGFSGNLPYAKYQTLFTPIYRYHVDYDNRDDAGYFVFTKGTGSGRVENESEKFNPAVLDSSVAAQAGALVAMNETYHYVFEHADAFTKLPSGERLRILTANKTASASTDYNNNMLYNLNEPLNKGMWVRPYTSFENLHLKNGPRADLISYGVLAGFDTDFRTMKHGWTNVGTGYLGYNGSVITYSGTSTTMNGGLLGFTETFYRKNFWTAITATAGASVGEANNMYGREEFTNFMAGVASKTGYNFEFKNGKFIIQPIWLMSYTFVNTFDYTNSAGIKIKSDPMHTIQLNPNVNFIANLRNGWKPYLSVGMVWNLMNETYFTANNVKLPEMHIRPYVEYGLGIQRVWKDRFTAFGQAMLRNGGRNGIAFTFGFRWTIGKTHNLTKVKTN